jgi:hypothetical protein
MHEGGQIRLNYRSGALMLWFSLICRTAIPNRWIGAERRYDDNSDTDNDDLSRGGNPCTEQGMRYSSAL